MNSLGKNFTSILIESVHLLFLFSLDLFDFQKLIAYLRGFSATGWLVAVLVRNIHDIRGFLLLLVVIIIGFATSFRALFGDTELSSYGSLSQSIISTFEMTILGEYDSAMLYESKYPAFSIAVFILAVTCVLVVALNALISILADSYARVQENAAANRRKERAELIVEYMSILPSLRRRYIEEQTKYFHALLEASADGDLLLGNDDWEGGLIQLRREMEELIHANAERQQKAMDQLKMDIDTEISSFRREVISLLEDISDDINTIRRLQSHDGVTFNGRNISKAVKAVKSIGRHGKNALFGDKNNNNN